MTWFRVDDSLPQHPKVLSIPRRQRTSAMGLWLMAGTWSAKNLTNGALGSHMVEELAGTEAVAEHLVKSGLWDRTGDGFLIHDYLDYNPSASEVKAEQTRKYEAKAKAGRSGGIASGIARRKHAGSTDEAETKQNEAPSRTRPVVASKEATARASEQNQDADLFDDFWRQYPRKDAKSDARKAWRQITKDVKPQEVLDGLAAYAFPAERQFMPLPASWLRGKRWEDESNQPHLRAVSGLNPRERAAAEGRPYQPWLDY